MTAAADVRITGKGFRLPETVRTNRDPIFDWLHENEPPGTDLFKGYHRRRVLAPGETLADIMVDAGFAALVDAGLDPQQVGLLTGFGSVSEYITPNALADVHHRMQLSERCLVTPVSDDFTNSLSGMMVADAMIARGICEHALVICGCNWTRYSNYHEPQAISSADGAGAFVLSRTDDRSRFRFVDHRVSTQLEGYGGMYMAPDQLGTMAEPVQDLGKDSNVLFSSAWYAITEVGQEMFSGFGENVPPRLVNELLAAHGLTGADITLVPYQASTVLTDTWREKIQPAQMILSLRELANMTLASIPVNFARSYDEIEKDWVAMVAVGPQFQALAVLLRRND